MFFETKMQTKQDQFLPKLKKYNHKLNFCLCPTAGSKKIPNLALTDRDWQHRDTSTRIGDTYRAILLYRFNMFWCIADTSIYNRYCTLITKKLYLAFCKPILVN